MRSTLFAIALAALAGAGCGGGTPLPPETDAAKGRETLKTVLDAWKRGGTIDEMRAAGVSVRDPDWSEGSKLKGYEIDAEDGRRGVDLLVTVKLTLARGDGQAQTKTVRYVVVATATSLVKRDE